MLSPNNRLKTFLYFLLSSCLDFFLLTFPNSQLSSQGKVYSKDSILVKVIHLKQAQHTPQRANLGKSPLQNSVC